MAWGSKPLVTKRKISERATPWALHPLLRHQPKPQKVTPLQEADEEKLVRMASQFQLRSDTPDDLRTHEGLSLMIPHPFAAQVAPFDQPMPTASPNTPGNRSTAARGRGPRIAAAPALPQPLRFSGRTMEPRRAFARSYETYLTAINALQTRWGGAFAMPAVLKAILDRFNLVDVAFEREQKRLVKYLGDALVPDSFLNTSCPLAYRCRKTRGIERTDSSGGRRGESRAAPTSGGQRGDTRPPGAPTHAESSASSAAPATGGAFNTTSRVTASRSGLCLRCQSTEHHVRERPLVGLGEAATL
ncbi:hypothetical protein GQ600_7776 [Phytophthora cactorum]|nr:hypothetical protein GQ600_7776 [Phytophthora cactorum]